MNEWLEYTLDKFTFKVATDRFYSPEGMWAKANGNLITVGVSDFFQQRNGDVAFAEVREVGTAVTTNDGFADIESIKVDIELVSPVNGTIVVVNDKLELEADLMTPEAYFEHMKVQAQEEAGSL